MALKIWSYEGERLVTLTDVSDETTQDTMYDTMYSRLTEYENEVTSDWPFEGVIFGGEQDPFPPNDNIGVERVEMTFDQYIEEVKQFVKQNY